jgi:hypothetical protein
LIFSRFFPPFLYASDSAGLQKQVFGYLFDFGEPAGMQLNSLDWLVVLPSSLPRDSSCLPQRKGPRGGGLLGFYFPLLLFYRVAKIHLHARRKNLARGMRRLEEILKQGA